MKILTRVLLAGIVLTAWVAQASAEKPGHHPAYVHAVSDLKDARAHIDYHGGNEPRDVEEDHAVREIDAANYAATHAAIKNDQPLKDHPPVDVHLARVDRLNQAHQLLDSARRDVSGPEDNPEARDLQRQAISHIDAAIHIVEDLQKKYR